MIHCFKTRARYRACARLAILSCDAWVGKHQSLSNALAFIAKPFVIGVIAWLPNPNVQVPQIGFKIILHGGSLCFWRISDSQVKQQGLFRVFHRLLG